MISDIKQNSSGISSPVFSVKLKSVSNYYAYGMVQPGRSWQSGEYRYGYNGKESDNEWKGSVNSADGVGGSVDYGARVYDAKLGTFLSVDRFQSMYPSMSHYTYAGNSPISALDLDGDSIFVYTRNMGVFVALDVLAATDLGKQLLERYANSSTEHLYISSADDIPVAAAHGVTTYDLAYWGAVKDGKLVFDETTHSHADWPAAAEMLASTPLQGVPVAESGGTHTAIVFANSQFESDGDIDVDRDPETIYHEVFAHVANRVTRPMPDPNNPSSLVQLPSESTEDHHDNYNRNNFLERDDDSPGVLIENQLKKVPAETVEAIREKYKYVLEMPSSYCP